MSKVVQAAEFFVVGGPVQPDRPCYVERAADGALAAAIRAREYCCVLGARAIGKTSLMARAARALRQTGGLAAIVDLAQLGARGDDADGERWAFGFAHRVAHDLHLDVDLQTWWREKTALAPESRLADFFWEVVLTNTTAAVTVFVDEIEQALALPFGRELLASIEACRVRREREADYGRLTFVLLGVAARERLGAAPDAPLAPEVLGIDLADFTMDEAYVLALGFGGERAQAQALMDRVCVWTHGQPYLTQKVARGVARKGGKLEDVERVVREQLLQPAAVNDDLLLSHARATLGERQPAARHALKLLRRIAKGAAVAVPADASVREVLELSGVVARAGADGLRYRNRVMREAFGARWIKSVAPAGWRTLVTAAALVALAAFGGYAYLNYLPMPYERVLVSDAADPAALAAAHSGLRRFPGFAERADRLLADALRRRSGSATDVAALANADAQLRTLPGQGELADRLLAEFWLRKVAAAVDAEQRDAALLFALRAARAGVGDTAGARAWVGELVGDDYRNLERTVQLPAAQASLRVDWQAAPALLSLTAENELVRTPFASADTGGASPAPRLSALRHAVLVRELEVEGEGSAGEFELSVALAHPASGEVALTLAAPSGAQATILLPRSNAASSESYVFPAQEGTPLAALADEERRGTWRLTLVDRRVENTGTLGGWGLRFGEEAWRDDPADGVAIPDPARTEAVTVEMSADDAFAIVQPADRGPVGSVALWNLDTGLLQDDFTLPLPPQYVAINAGATRLLAATANLVTLWDVAGAMPVARLATQTEFVLPPAFSSDGGYVAIAERVEGERPLYSLLRAEDGSLLASVEGLDRVERWWLGPGARYLALLGPSTVLRFIDARSGKELTRAQDPHDIARVLPLPDGASLITVDVAGEIRAWRADATEGAAGRRLGEAAAADAVVLSSDGARLAYPTGRGEIVVRDVASGARVATLRDGMAGAAVHLRLAPDGSRLVAASGERARLWSVPNVPSAGTRATDVELTALDVDRARPVLAVGLRSGQLRFGDADGAATTTAAGVEFFGHRGAVTAVAVDAARGVAVTGGIDGIVRVWDLASGEPVTPVLAHAVPSGDGPILAVALSPDARWIASAAAGTVRLWSAADGALVSELPFGGSTATLAFPSDGALLAIGDGGGVRLVPIAPNVGSIRTTPARAAIISIAFAPSGELFASGDAAGNLQLARVATGEAIGVPYALASAIRKVGFGGDGVLLAVTDAWAHSFTIGTAGLIPRGARRLPFSQTPAIAVAAAEPERVRVAGFDALGTLGYAELDLGAPPGASVAPPAEVFERDWPSVLGLRLDDAGEPTLASP
jgi:WD40 repeat protein/subtilisin-like proprotein convertase family protein